MSLIGTPVGGEMGVPARRHSSGCPHPKLLFAKVPRVPAGSGKLIPCAIVLQAALGDSAGVSPAADISPAVLARRTCRQDAGATNRKLAKDRRQERKQREVRVGHPALSYRNLAVERDADVGGVNL